MYIDLLQLQFGLFRPLKIKTILQRVLLNAAKRKFYFPFESFPSIISNDCFGGEIYRSLGIPYNTPFVGLMLMAPCYITLLKNLEYYLEQDLTFIKQSKYPNINELIISKGYFPIAQLGDDVELHFLHYKSDFEAKEKWNKRKKRVDINNLFIKFDYSKDCSNKKILEEFLSLEYKRKLAIGSSQTKTAHLKCGLVDLPEYDMDATKMFRLSLKYLDYEKMFKYNVLSKPPLLKGYFLSKCLNHGWENNLNKGK